MEDNKRVIKARDRLAHLLSLENPVEAEFQSLFNENKFILTSSLLLGLPEDKLKSARPGRAEADFYFYQDSLLSPYGVIELKRPSAQIWMSPRKGVFCLHSDAYKALSQAGKYCDDIKNNIINHRRNKRVIGDNRLMFVIAGRCGEAERKFGDNFIMPERHLILPGGGAIYTYDQVFEFLDEQCPELISVIYPLQEFSLDQAVFLSKQVGDMFSKFNILEDEKYIYGAYGNYTSKHLVCGDCGADYVFSAAEQEFYASKDLSAPRRCGNCRKTKRAMRAIAPRRDTITTCVQCGTYITVPFVPDGTRPILCRDCFAASRTR